MKTIGKEKLTKTLLSLYTSYYSRLEETSVKIFDIDKTSQGLELHVVKHEDVWPLFVLLKDITECFESVSYTGTIIKLRLKDKVYVDLTWENSYINFVKEEASFYCKED